MVIHKLLGTVESFLFMVVRGLSKWGRNSVVNWFVALQYSTIYLLNIRGEVNSWFIVNHQINEH